MNYEQFKTFLEKNEIEFKEHDPRDNKDVNDLIGHYAILFINKHISFNLQGHLCFVKYEENKLKQKKSTTAELYFDNALEPTMFNIKNFYEIVKMVLGGARLVDIMGKKEIEKKLNDLRSISKKMKTLRKKRRELESWLIEKKVSFST